jgi:hypothetical protein
LMFIAEAVLMALFKMASPSFFCWSWEKICRNREPWDGLSWKDRSKIFLTPLHQAKRLQ